MSLKTETIYKKVATIVAVMALAPWASSVGAVPQGAPRSRGMAAWTAFEGCAPPTGSSGRRFFLDPARGANGNDGSLRRPWPGLQSALGAHEADIRPGDTLLLMSGDHGDVALKRANAGFVHLEAAPGATPILRHLYIGGAKWALSGITFMNDHPGALVDIRGDAHDIVVEKSRLLSAEGAGRWTPRELAASGATGVYTDGRGAARCLTIRDNSILYVDYGAKLTTNKTVFAGNTIDRFGGDGIDYHGSDLTIAFNTITNAREVDTGEHIDAIQGFAPGGSGWDTKSNTHVTIEGNVVIRQVDPSLAYPAAMQGIDAFDGDWTDLRVVNNVVITNAYHGIFFSSVHHGLIANNTVISDQGSTFNHPPNIPQGFKMNGEKVWIGVGDRTHQGASSSDVVLRNNIAQSMQLNALPGAVKVDHNIVYHGWFQGMRGDPHPITAPVNGGGADHNRLAPGIVHDFVAYDPKSFRFDLHLKTGSAAVGAGNPDAAPATDVDGASRGATMDIGAYAYRGG